MVFIRYKGASVLIGTCEFMTCITYHKYVEALHKGFLTQEPEFDLPVEYARPDSGHWFRLPFNDEKDLEFGEIQAVDKNHSFGRRLIVTINRGTFFKKGSFLPPAHLVDDPGYMKKIREVNGANPNNSGETVDLELAYQGPATVPELNKVCLVLAYRCPYSERTWSVRALDELHFIMDQVIQRYLLSARDLEQKIFWMDMVHSLFKGYLGIGSRISTVKEINKTPVTQRDFFHLKTKV